MESINNAKCNLFDLAAGLLIMLDQILNCNGVNLDLPNWLNDDLI